MKRITMTYLDAKGALVGTDELVIETSSLPHVADTAKTYRPVEVWLQPNAEHLEPIGKGRLVIAQVTGDGGELAPDVILHVLGSTLHGGGTRPPYDGAVPTPIGV